MGVHVDPGEWSIDWLKSFRRVHTRYEVYLHLYDGFVCLACALLAAARL